MPVTPDMLHTLNNSPVGQETVYPPPAPTVTPPGEFVGVPIHTSITIVSSTDGVFSRPGFSAGPPAILTGEQKPIEATYTQADFNAGRAIGQICLYFTGAPVHTPTFIITGIRVMCRF